MKDKEKILFEKDCDCKSTSSTNRTRAGKCRIKKDAVVQTFHFYSQPSCGECGKPWKIVNKEEVHQ